MIDFIQFAEDRGLIIKSLEHGRWARVPTIDHPHKRNGAYWFGGEFGHVQNWSCMDKVESWQDKKERTPFEHQAMLKRMEDSKKSHTKERAEGQVKAASKARWILIQCELDKHAYLDTKGFKEICLNVWRKEDQSPLLVIPMFFKHELCGCQLIDIDGNKKFLTGQRTNDATFTIGNKGRHFLCEGYATGLSIQAVLTALHVNYVIHVCFSAGNLLRVAKTLPDAFVIADNDASGTGERVARESGLKWFMSEVVGEDFNDLHKRAGTFRASQILRKEL